MLEEQTNRRLVAILAADVVGYSKMMAADEAGTLAALKAHRESVFNPSVERHNGRIVKLIGDGTLVEFTSVVDAVKCALDIQLRAADEARGDFEIKLRIGVNLGDVIIDGDDIYGDGVNVAARLEPLAETGGICVSSIVNESVGTRVDVSFEDGGEVAVKNIDRPIRVWKWRPSAASPARTATAAEDGDAMTQASIAVLPFDNMSGDPEQEYFSDGITEDLITDLSKVGGLMVIARNSSFAYKGKSPDIRQVGRELGVASVLEGSIRKAGNRVRITAQLIDAAHGGHLWAERYDRDLTDIFEVQDEVTRKIVEALRVHLSPADAGKLKDAGTRSVEAHDLFLKARELLQGPTKNRQVYDQAVALLKGALDLDPDYADAYAVWAMACVYDYQNRWTDEADTNIGRGIELARKAVQLAPDDHLTNYVMTVAYGVAGRTDEATPYLDRALEINPNSAEALNARGVLEIVEGKLDAAIDSIEKANQVDPVNGQQYLHFLGVAHLLKGNYETAAATFKQRIALVPDTDMSRSMLASTLGHLGELDEARKVWAEMMEINPDYSFAEHMKRTPIRSAEPVLADGLGKAGLLN